MSRKRKADAPLSEDAPNRKQQRNHISTRKVTSIDPSPAYSAAHKSNELDMWKRTSTKAPQHDSDHEIHDRSTASRVIDTDTVEFAEMHHIPSAEKSSTPSLPSVDHFSSIRDTGLTSTTILSLGLATLTPATTTELIAFNSTLCSRAADLGILRDRKGPESDEGTTGTITIPKIKISLAPFTADHPEAKKYKTFPLMRLPAELRTAIFEYALTDPQGGRIVVSHDLKTPSLTRTCRQLRNEALPIWFAMNTFHFNIEDCNASLLYAFCQLYNVMSKRWTSKEPDRAENSDEAEVFYKIEDSDKAEETDKAALQCSMSIWGERNWWSLVEWCKGVFQNEMLPCISIERQDSYEAALCRATSIAEEDREQGKTWKECDHNLGKLWGTLRVTDDEWSRAPTELPNWLMDPEERELFEKASWAVGREDGEWVWPRWWFGEEWELEEE